MSQTLHDKIEAYLADAMPPDERKSFEQTIAADPLMAEEVALYELEREGHELLIEQELREKALAWMGDPVPLDEGRAQKPAIAGRYQARFLWAIGLVLISVFAWGLYRALRRDLPTAPQLPSETPTPLKSLEPAGETPTPPIAQQNSPKPTVPGKMEPVTAPSPQQLLAMAYYQKPDFAGEMRRSGRGNSPDTALSAAAAAWANNDSLTVISLVKSIPASDPYYVQAQEMLGHAYFLTKNYTKAAAAFAGIRTGTPGEMSERAAWYEALVWVAAGQLGRAKLLLEEIRRDTGHPYQEEATGLLDKIK